MCGIVGAVAHRDITDVLLEGLRRLEYRGYDSAGVAVLDRQGQLRRCRQVGKIRELESALKHEPLAGHTGIAHTRWATHGVPSVRNAHPHVSEASIPVAVVHNGIIENHENLRQELQQLGYVFTSETDTEVIVHLVHHYLQQGGDLKTAIQQTLARLTGAYAIAVITPQDPHRMIVAREGSPLVLGLGDNELFIASDVFALLGETQRFIYLEDGDVAELTPESYQIHDAQGRMVTRELHQTRMAADAVERGVYRHYMQKEIHEQPVAIEKTLDDRIENGQVMAGQLDSLLEKVLPDVRAVQIVACGTSYHAGMVARYWFEAIAGIPCQVEVASEFRYRPKVVRPGTLFVTISQSGETADTLAALKDTPGQGYLHTLAICNVAESSLVRASASALMTRAGPEIGVASTKAFTTQLVALLLLVVATGRSTGYLSAAEEATIVSEIQRIPSSIQDILELEPVIAQWAESFGDKHHALFLGRGTHYPVAMEGALKLKEISYIHAEAYPAGELKHGPLALIDQDMPVIAVAPQNDLLEKLKSNLQEVHARGGQLFVFAEMDAAIEKDESIRLIRLDRVADLIAPIVYTVPLQLLAYHVALIKGTDVDQPRNLAKSVTVE
ncbi:MAG: hypothetical protein RIQ52_921 [Pseudomonadota bacterium]